MIASPPLERATTPQPAERGARERLARKRQAVVMLVDDNEAFREIVDAWLGDRYRLLAAADALSALTVVAHTPPDVILLDVMMPAMSGLELLDALRGFPSLAAIPVILVTVYPVHLDPQAADAVKNCHVLRKPFDRAALLASIDAALEGTAA